MAQGLGYLIDRSRHSCSCLDNTCDRPFGPRQPFENQVTRLRLSPDLTAAAVDKVITSALFQT